MHLQETRKKCHDTCISQLINRRDIVMIGSLSTDVPEPRTAAGSFLLTHFDTIASVMASHQTSKQDFSSPRQLAETVQQKEQLTSGCRSWLTDVCA